MTTIAHCEWRRLWSVVLVLLLIVPGLMLGLTAPADANSSTHGLPELQINPGGGAATDGSDGINFVLNGHEDGSASHNGSDQVYYRNTSQYCCNGSSPLLNIGGTLYGEAGPAVERGVSSWTSVEILPLGGSATTDPTATETGSGAAMLRYTVNHEGLDYVVERTVSYTYPNSFVIEEYQFTIPAGNTEVVKFYYGGDAAPGDVDLGAVAVMVTDPVRAIYSVSPDAGIQIGYSEVPGGDPFDGANAGEYFDPYDDVENGADIGFVADREEHDAGIMMQRTLPTAPGRYDRALKLVTGDQGVSLSVVPRSLEAVTGDSLLLDLAILNTGFDTEPGLGYTYQLPEGIVVGDGSIENSCGGTVAAEAGSLTIQLSGVSVAEAENCVTSVPVVAVSAGIIEFNRDAVKAPEGALLNGVGIYTVTVTEEPVDPVDPVDPEEPVDPFDPVGPAEPVEPNEPTQPVDPVDHGTCAALRGWDVIGFQVEGLYQSLLGRASDPDGLTYWTQARLSGMPARKLAALILDSPERQATHSHQSDEDFVDGLYADGLGRRADPSGREYWLGQLAAGLHRADLAVLFSNLALVESQGDTSALITDHQALVCRLYRTLFDRSPDDGGYVYWTRLLDSGLAPATVAEAMLATAEARPLSQTDNEGFVDHLHRRSAFQRPADQFARRSWAQQIRTRGRAWTVIEIANRIV